MLLTTPDMTWCTSSDFTKKWWYTETKINQENSYSFRVIKHTSHFFFSFHDCAAQVNQTEWKLPDCHWYDPNFFWVKQNCWQQSLLLPAVWAKSHWTNITHLGPSGSHGWLRGEAEKVQSSHYLTSSLGSTADINLNLPAVSLLETWMDSVLRH